MEQIQLIFFALASFFGMEDARIAAELTTVTINPMTKEVVILQENLFTIPQAPADTTLVLQQWNQLVQWKELETPWATELDSFPAKDFILLPKKDSLHPQLTLTYATERDLRSMGIWYNEAENKFSINEVPQYHIKTKTGTLVGNYWIFEGNETFSFTLEPFLEMPEEYTALKVPLLDLVGKAKD